MAYRHAPEATRTRAIALWRQGLSTGVISSRTGLSAAYIRELIRKIKREESKANGS